MENKTLLATFVNVMKKGWENISLKSVALLMVTVIAMLTFNQSVNLHTHQLADGTIVSHAHPYNKTSDSAPVKNHHHTLAEFLILQHFEILFLSLFIAIVLLYTTQLVKRKTQKEFYLKAHYIHYAPGRAPPFLS